MAGEASTVDTAAFDLEVRRHIYDQIVEHEHMPLASEIALHMSRSVEDVRESLQRMKAAHVLVLQEGDDEILMANPFSAVPTAFEVRIGGKMWWGNCIWDALGIAAMVKGDAAILTGCADCNDPITIHIEGGTRIEDGAGIIHFSVPASRWWDNIKFT